jgi:putative ABC transport system ATP-binding protein
MIRLSAVSRCFILGDQQVKGLDQVDLQVSRGEYLAVMGPSGSGKSTLLNILGLLDAPDSGEYWLNGEATAALDENRRAELRSRHIGFVFQSYHLIPRLTALENIELPMLLAGIEPAERHRRSARLVERLNLGDRVRHRPAELSGGQRPRHGHAAGAAAGGRAHRQPRQPFRRRGGGAARRTQRRGPDPVGGDP